MGGEYQEYLDRYGLKADGYTYMEMLAVAVSREMPNGSFAFVGTGLPLLASSRAQQTHAKDITITLEAGTVGPRIKHLPLSIADPRAAYQASTLSTLVDAFGTIATRGYCTAGVLGVAECDMYGNLNSTTMGNIGTPEHRKAAKVQPHASPAAAAPTASLPLPTRLLP